MTRLTWVLVAPILVAATAGPARAQPPDPLGPVDGPARLDACEQSLFLYEPAVRPTHNEFLERNQIFYNVPPIGPPANEGLLFEALVAPHFYFYNGLHKTAYRSRCDRYLQAFSLTMQFRIRMVDDTSTPVRPPSYMPRFNYQGFYFWDKRPLPEHPLGSLFAGTKLLTMTALRASLGHHSNGQQYCRFDEQKRIPDPGDTDPTHACPPVDVNQAPNLDRLNFRSGDFATNHVQLALHHAWIALSDEWEVGRLAIGLVGESNALWLRPLPGSIDHEEYAMYGPHRLRAELEYSRALDPSWLPAGSARASTSYERFSKTAPDVARYRFLFEIAYTPFGLEGLGLFARYFAGQDYLNILYLRPAVKTVQLGLQWDFSTRPQWGFRPGGKDGTNPSP